jgi:hypothetical protein
VLHNHLVFILNFDICCCRPTPSNDNLQKERHVKLVKKRLGENGMCYCYITIFILILVVVDPSPETSTCKRKRQSTCPSHSKVTEIIA